jgi:hypothetical protein
LYTRVVCFFLGIVRSFVTTLGFFVPRRRRNVFSPRRVLGAAQAEQMSHGVSVPTQQIEVSRVQLDILGARLRGPRHPTTENRKPRTLTRA